MNEDIYVVIEHLRGQVAEISYTMLAAGRELAQGILEDNLPVRLQLQLHKLLWNDERGR